MEAFTPKEQALWDKVSKNITPCPEYVGPAWGQSGGCAPLMHLAKTAKESGLQITNPRFIKCNPHDQLQYLRWRIGDPYVSGDEKGCCYRVLQSVGR
jgi:hypothetical protein